MTDQPTTGLISTDVFRDAFLALWTEIFEPTGDGPHWILDGGTSMFETLADITAEEASIPVSNQSANLAAQVNHTSYYIEELREGLATNFTNNADWPGSWQVGEVTEAEWQALVERLRVSYEWMAGLSREIDVWESDYVGGAIAMVAHAAYHLGEIRQGIGIIRSR